MTPTPVASAGGLLTATLAGAGELNAAVVVEDVVVVVVLDAAVVCVVVAEVGEGRAGADDVGDISYF